VIICWLPASTRYPNSWTTLGRVVKVLRDNCEVRDETAVFLANPPDLTRLLQIMS
jgi:hypothetical protein